MRSRRSPLATNNPNPPFPTERSVPNNRSSSVRWSNSLSAIGLRPGADHETVHTFYFPDAGDLGLRKHDRPISPRSQPSRKTKQTHRDGIERRNEISRIVAAWRCCCSLPLHRFPSGPPTGLSADVPIGRTIIRISGGIVERRCRSAVIELGLRPVRRRIYPTDWRMPGCRADRSATDRRYPHRRRAASPSVRACSGTRRYCRAYSARPSG